MNHDAYMIECVKAKPNTSLSWLLMASYLYYHRPELPPILSDTKFDLLCRKVATVYSRLTHRHKHLVEEEGLSTGSLYFIPRDNYPTIVKSCAVQLSKELE